MRLYIVRHGYPEGITDRKRYLGITDEALSDEGMKQAADTGKRIAASAGNRPVRIVSSPLIRCFETAMVIKEHVCCGFVETDPDLREIDMGEWDGRYFDEIKAEYPSEFEARGMNLWNYRAPGGESFAETGARFMSAFDRLTKWASKDDVIIMVSHAGAIRAGMSLLTGKPFDEWMKRKIPYAGYTILDVSDNRIKELTEE